MQADVDRFVGLLESCNRAKPKQLQLIFQDPLRRVFFCLDDS